MGRETELAQTKACFKGTAAGTAFTVVVSGDPGVGKTALVHEACAAMSSEVLVLSGACLPLASMAVPFVALRSAIRQAPRSEHIPAPVIGMAGSGSTIVAIDDWLTELCRIRPVALVIDDLQWAGQSTLDTLMYLIAGPAERRLTILATLRHGEVGEGHPLQRWLADMRRMPRISWLALGPLDRQATGAQMAQVFGVTPHQSLVQEVFSHTAGNPYLTRLILEGLGPESRHLPARLPEDLGAAVLRSWHGMSRGARQLTQLMAVGGRPLPVQDLSDLARRAGPGCDVPSLLHEALEPGLVECGPEGTHWWFHHPIIPEVLEQGLEVAQRRHWHALFASHAERLLARGTPPDYEFLAALAHHHDAAGHVADAYRWTLRASAAAAAEGYSGTGELLRLLNKALELHSRLPTARESREELLVRLRTAAEDAGAMDEELEAVNALLEVLDQAQRPLDVAELLVRRTLLRFSTGLEFLSGSQLLRAVTLAREVPESWQHAYALAELAHAGLWKNDPEAPVQAARSLDIARKAGNPRALSYALSANSMAALFGARILEARELAAGAASAAARARDFWALVHATAWQANATETWISPRFAGLMRAGRERLAELGAPHVYISKLAADEASSYLAIGQWRECGAALRVALGSDPGPLGDVAVRLTAARLAALQGAQDQAQAHLDRAEELFAHKSGYNNLDFDAVRAEVRLAAGEPAAAYSAAMAGAAKEGQPPTMCEWLIPLAARALADQVQEAIDDGRPHASILALTQELASRFPSVIRDAGNDTDLYAAQVSAFTLWYEAEIGRARSSPGNAAQWIAASDACQAASLRWEEAYSCWRGVQALLLRGHSGHGRATDLLRRGFSLAEELRAQPILASLNEIAARARIATTVPATGRPAGRTVDFPGLTAREREVLEHVVAGRTYAEIARVLVISEKTVSSHISRLLAKTGTANRLDLSRLATRRGAGRTPMEGGD